MGIPGVSAPTGQSQPGGNGGSAEIGVGPSQPGGNGLSGLNGQPGTVSVVQVVTCYADLDGDTYGDANDPGTPAISCGAGTVSNKDDCDDANAAVNPAAQEICNGGVDDDCDGLIDDADPSVTGLSTFYQDTDGDGYGGSSSTTACVAPVGYVGNNLDCDDANLLIHPGAAEVCNGGVDDDCDGLADDADPGVTGQATWYADADGDSFGNAGASVLACAPPQGYVADKTDCDDTNPTIYPGAPEIKDDGIDQNCDGIDASCCVALTGNVDCDPSDGADISDLTALIDNLYITFAPLCCDGEANTDGQPGIDISDLTALIDYLYISFAPPAACQ